MDGLGEWEKLLAGGLLCRGWGLSRVGTAQTRPHFSWGRSALPLTPGSNALRAAYGPMKS